MPLDKVPLGIGIRKNDDVGTPDSLYEHFKEKYRLSFDPCPLGGLLDGADGLEIPWGDRSFVNPPYSATSKWVEKAVHESFLGKFVCVLVPWRSNSKYWQKFVLPHATKIHILSKVTFKGYKRKCPIPMALIVFDGTIKDAKMRKKSTVKKDDYFAYYTLK